MKRLIIFAFLALIPFMGMAQQNTQTKESPILTPKVVVGDLVFVVQVLKTVEIKGAEVDAYLQVQQTFDKLIQDLNAQQKKVNDTVDIKIPLNIAQATVTFMDRATLQGQNATIYKRFVDALVASTKTK